METQEEYVRRMVSGDDLAFQPRNGAWNVERGAHLMECVRTVLGMLSPDQFVKFHNDYVEEFNSVCEHVDMLSGEDQNWFDQPGSIRQCTGLLNRLIRLILAMLDLVREV
jgi:hypothetical protein